MPPDLNQATYLPSGDQRGLMLPASNPRRVVTPVASSSTHIPPLKGSPTTRFPSGEIMTTEPALPAEPRSLPCRFRHTYCQFRPCPEPQASSPALELEARNWGVNDRATTPSATGYGSPAASSRF